MPMGARNALTVQGDLLRVPADAIVNPWNRNYMPRWLRPGGISGQLQAATGPGPWDELASHGLLQLGEAVVTSAGQLTTARSLIHVAGLNLLWRASPRSVALSVHSAVEAAVAHRFATITMPLIGAGHGHLSADASRSTIHAALGELRHVPLPQPLAVRIVELPAAAA